MFMKLVDHSSNIGWKVHEQAWNPHEIEFALMGSHITKGACSLLSLDWFSCLEHVSQFL
jgi:hypothetical protein